MSNSKPGATGMSPSVKPQYNNEDEAAITIRRLNHVRKSPTTKMCSSMRKKENKLIQIKIAVTNCSASKEPLVNFNEDKQRKMIKERKKT